MKVYMTPSPDKLGESGIKQVCLAYRKYLPAYGVQFVDNDHQADLIASHAGSYPAPTVLHCHGLYFTGDYEAASWEWSVNADVINAIRHAGAVTVPSAWVAEIFQRDMRFTPDVIPHGIEWGEWQHKETCQGYVLWNKNRAADVCSPAVLTDLARRFKQVQFVSTYAPDEKPANISVTGVVAHLKMKQYVQRAAVYLSTTKETFGIGVLEAMAAGVPVLGWAHGGNLELVQHGVNGYLARPGNLEDLYAGLDYCRKHRQVLGDNGRELARAWTWQAAVEKVWQVYQAALHEEPATVGVVIPVYNKTAEQVKRAVESVRAQTSEPAKIVVINDGSTEHNEDIEQLARDYLVQGDFIYQRTVNQGVANARNHGITLARTKYITCLDADDWLEPDFLEICVKALEDDRTLGIAYTGLKWHSPNGDSGISQWPGPFNYDGQLKRKNQVPTACVFRREAWARVGGYRQRYAPNGAGSEDAAFWTAIGAIGYGGRKVTDRPLFNYWTGGTVGGNPNYREVDWLQMYPWVKDEQHPFASIVTAKKFSHPVRQYDEPVISVIIPVGPGHEKEVTNALDSLEMQHYRKWEAVVVWDAGNNEWVDQYLLTAYPYIRLISTGPKSGAGYARNRGVELARAPLLFFLDADDVLSDPHALDKMLDAWGKEEAIIYSDYVGKSTWPKERAQKEFGERLLGYIDRTGQAIVRYYAAEYDYNLAVQQPKLSSDPRMPYYLWCTVSVLVPRAWHLAVGGFDETMATWEDVDYFWRLARAGYCFKRLPEPLLLYNFDSGNRREASIPRNEGARQKHKNLIEYVKLQYAGLPVQMCKCRGNNKPVVTATAAAASGSDADYVLIEFHFPGEETRSSYGQPLLSPTAQRIGGKLIDYNGYSRRGGDRFLVHRADASARPSMFRPVTETTPAPEVEIAPAPEPVPIAAPEPVALKRTTRKR